MTLKERLIALKKKYMKRCSEELAIIEEKLITEMTAEFLTTVGEDKYAGYCCGGDSDIPQEERIKADAEMFVTNQLVEYAIGWDASGDWDGSARAENLEEYITGEDDEDDGDDDDDDE